MFTLILLLIDLAAVVLPAIAAAQRPLPVIKALPLSAMGLSWRRLGERNTKNGSRVLWLGTGDEAVFSRLYRGIRTACAPSASRGAARRQPISTRARTLPAT